MNEDSINPDSTLRQLRMKQQVQEQPFVSRVPIFGPLIARLRAAWNSVSTKWYVRPLLQQQNEFNELAVNQLTDQAARLQQQEMCLSDHEHRFDERAARLADLTARLTDRVELQDARLTDRVDLQDARVHDHDAWLVAQDREASEIVRDLAGLRLQLGQMNRLLQELNQRVDGLDAENAPREKERVA